MSSSAAVLLRPPPAEAAGGIVLISAQAAAESVLATGSIAGNEVALYGELVSALLRHQALEVVLHAGPRFAIAAELKAAIADDRRLSGAERARFAIIEQASLAAMLPRADLLVSFASAALAEGCENGLKPVQIGRELAATREFSHVFPDVAGFAAALASGAVGGRLSLSEYEAFEDFCRDLRQRPSTLAGALRLARDPIIRACRRRAAPAPSPLRIVLSALANPFAAWRLLLGSYRATAPHRPPRP